MGLFTSPIKLLGAGVTAAAGTTGIGTLIVKSITEEKEETATHVEELEMPRVQHSESRQKVTITRETSFGSQDHSSIDRGGGLYEKYGIGTHGTGNIGSSIGSELREGISRTREDIQRDREELKQHGS